MSYATISSDLRIAVIIGSVRNGRIGDRVGAWVQGRLADAGVKVDLIDLAEVTVPGAMHGHPDVADLTARIDRATAVIVVTPEYNRSYPGPMKSAIDSVREPWRAKPVAFVSYGGVAGGLHAVEALRSVFAELHAVTIRETVSFAGPWGRFDEDGRCSDDTDAVEALHRLLAQLDWWADALESARERQPYPA